MATVAFLLLQPAWVGAAHLDLVVEASTSCQGGYVSLPPFTTVKGSIRAYPEGGDIRGVQFAIQGLPSNQVITTYTPTPALASAFGNPFGAGASVVFNECQIAPVGVTLYEVTLYSLGPFSGPVTFQPLQSLNPDTCPMVSGCDLVATCAPGFVVSRPFAPGLISPANGATRVPIDAHLQWTVFVPEQCACAGLPWSLVFLGTDPNPPQVGFLSDRPPDFDPGLLQPSTTYYWRVEEWLCTGGNSSGVSSFRTRDPIAVRTHTWAEVKTLYE